MRTTRKPSTVMVNEVNLSVELAKALTAFNAKLKPGAEKAKAMTTRTWGFAEAKNGDIYALCNEGVGSFIDERRRLSIELYAEYDHSFSIFPDLILQMDRDEFTKLPIVRRVYLHNFIRSFGSRLEDNYSDWQKALS